MKKKSRPSAPQTISVEQYRQIMLRGKRAHKYRAKPKTINGIRYASTAEADRAAELELNVRAGLIRSFRRQPEYHLGCPENVYVADFEVTGKLGSLFTEDVKGVETPKFRRDKKLWAKYGPHPLLVMKRKGKGWKREIIVPEAQAKQQRIYLGIE